jgi:hypothetical protein
MTFGIWIQYKHTYKLCIINYKHGGGGGGGGVKL